MPVLQIFHRRLRRPRSSRAYGTSSTHGSNSSRCPESPERPNGAQTPHRLGECRQPGQLRQTSCFPRHPRMRKARKAASATRRGVFQQSRLTAKGAKPSRFRAAGFVGECARTAPRPCSPAQPSPRRLRIAVKVESERRGYVGKNYRLRRWHVQMSHLRMVPAG